MDRSGFFKKPKSLASRGSSRSIRIQIRSPGFGSKTVVSSRVRLKGGNWRVRSTEVCWMVAFMVISVGGGEGAWSLTSFRQGLLHHSTQVQQMIWKTKRCTFDLSKRALVMGVLNVTTDSFSDGGKFIDIGRAVDHGLQLSEEG